MVSVGRVASLRAVVFRNRSFGALMLAQVVTAVGALLINVAAARALGPEGRGELALFLQLSYLLGAGMTLGRDMALPASQDNKAPVALRLTRLFTLPMILGVTLAVMVGAAMPSAVGPLIGGLALTALVAGNLTSRALRTYAICTKNTRGYLVGTLLSQLFTVGGSFVLLFLSSISTATWLGVYAVSMLAPPAVVLMLARARDVREFGTTKVDSPHARRLGWRLAPSYFFDFATSRLDRLAVPIFAGYAQLGLYIVIATMVELTIWPVRQYVDSSVPGWAALHRTGKLRQLRILGTAVLIILPMTLVVGSLVYVLTVPLYGQEYQEGIKLILPLSVAVALHALVIVIMGLATAENRARAAAATTITTLVVSLALYGLLIPGGGAFGAAIALAVAYGLGAAVGLFGILRNAKFGRVPSMTMSAHESTHTSDGVQTPPTGR